MNTNQVRKKDLFSELFATYYPSLVLFAKRYIMDQEICEDLVQEIFVNLLEKKEQMSEVRDLEAYLYTMVRYKCFNYLRDYKITADLTDEATKLWTDADINNYLREETYRLIYQAVDELPPQCCQIFKLYLEGYSAKEIAVQLHIAVETVKKQKFLARKILRDKLGKLYLFFLFFT